MARVPLHDPDFRYSLPPLPTVCCDWMDVEELAPPAPTAIQQSESAFKLLVFMAIGRKQVRNIETTVRLIAGGGFNVSFFFAHYDGSHQWYKSTQSWYHEVEFRVSYPELVKSRFVANELVKNATFAVELLQRFSHVRLLP